jgi:hypothetical protein
MAYGGSFDKYAAYALAVQSAPYDARVIRQICGERAMHPSKGSALAGRSEESRH